MNFIVNKRGNKSSTTIEQSNAHAYFAKALTSYRLSPRFLFFVVYDIYYQVTGNEEHPFCSCDHRNGKFW